MYIIIDMSTREITLVKISNEYKKKASDYHNTLGYAKSRIQTGDLIISQP